MDAKKRSSEAPSGSFDLLVSGVHNNTYNDDDNDDDNDAISRLALLQEKKFDENCSIATSRQETLHIDKTNEFQSESENSVTPPQQCGPSDLQTNSERNALKPKSNSFWPTMLLWEDTQELVRITVSKLCLFMIQFVTCVYLRCFDLFFCLLPPSHREVQAKVFKLFVSTAAAGVAIGIAIKIYLFELRATFVYFCAVVLRLLICQLLNSTLALQDSAFVQSIIAQANRLSKASVNSYNSLYASIHEDEETLLQGGNALKQLVGFLRCTYSGALESCNDKIHTSYCYVYHKVKYNMNLIISKLNSNGCSTCTCSKRHKECTVVINKKSKPFGFNPLCVCRKRCIRLQKPVPYSGSLGMFSPTSGPVTGARRKKSINVVIIPRHQGA